MDKKLQELQCIAQSVLDICRLGTADIFPLHFGAGMSFCSGCCFGLSVLGWPVLGVPASYSESQCFRVICDRCLTPWALSFVSFQPSERPCSSVEEMNCKTRMSMMVFGIADLNLGPPDTG